MLLFYGKEYNCEEKGLASLTLHLAEKDKKYKMQHNWQVTRGVVGHWPLPTENRKWCMLYSKAHARAKYEKRFLLRVEIVVWNSL